MAAGRAKVPGRLLGAALAALLASGCVSTRDIASESTKLNVGVEQAHNQVLLLNALRASKRRPMYFTAVVSANAPVGQVSPSVGVTIPIGGEANPPWLVNPSIRADRPSLNVAVLDSQKFVAGITTPVRPALFKYYVDQGWPETLLFSLMIREIVYDEGGDERRVANNPGRRGEFEEFQGELRALAACGLKLVESDPLGGQESPAFTLPDSAHVLSALAGAAQGGMVVVPDRDGQGNPTGRWQLARPRGDVLLLFTRADAPACAALPAEQRRRLLGEDGKGGRVRGAVSDIPGPLGSRRPVRLMLRSPEAVIYYLGELVRADLEGDSEGVRYTPTTRINPLEGAAVPIFKVHAGALPEAFVSVAFDGAEYSVVSLPGDRSSHSLTLVSQLVGLQKEASELPITAPIHVITQ